MCDGTPRRHEHGWNTDERGSDGSTRMAQGIDLCESVQSVSSAVYFRWRATVFVQPGQLNQARARAAKETER